MDRFVTVRKKRKSDTGTPEKTNKTFRDDPETSSSSVTETDGDKSGSLDLTFPRVLSGDLQWKKVKAADLDLDYTLLLPRIKADDLLAALEREVDYFTGEMAQVQVFGKWHNIPRKQATYGDAGLSYKYSGRVTPARPWPPALAATRDLVKRVTGHNFNFVLVNRYQDGRDKMGEHKDDERELDPNIPIASLSLGQARDFYFRHQDSRPPKKLNIEKVELQLEHGSLLLMNAPTNKYWYHALPPRTAAVGVRVNLTFRRVVPQHAKGKRTTTTKP